MPGGLPGRRRFNKTLGYRITGDTIRYRLTRHDVGERAECDAAIKRVGHHRRVVRTVVEEVMGDLRPAGAAWVELLRTAVHHVKPAKTQVVNNMAMWQGGPHLPRMNTALKNGLPGEIGSPER